MAKQDDAQITVEARGSSEKQAADAVKEFNETGRMPAGLTLRYENRYEQNADGTVFAAESVAIVEKAG